MIEATYSLACDKCCYEFGQGDDEKHLRDMAKATGWTSFDGVDFCSNCSKEESETSKTEPQ